jgi:hypothetical protein
MTIDVMEDIISKNFGYQNGSKLAWLAFLKIRDNIIGDCIDPWLVDPVIFLIRRGLDRKKIEI